jgi:hypothetical protein
MDSTFLKFNSFGTDQFKLGLGKTQTWTQLASELKLQMSTVFPLMGGWTFKMVDLYIPNSITKDEH